MVAQLGSGENTNKEFVFLSYYIHSHISGRAMPFEYNITTTFPAVFSKSQTTLQKD